jgi:hypothetical protein
VVAFDAYLDARRIGKVTEGFRRLALGELCAIEIDPHLDATIGGACKRLHDGQVGQHICGQVDFMLGAIDQGDVDVFEVFGRRVMNDRPGSAEHGASEARKGTAIREVRNKFNVATPGPERVVDMAPCQWRRSRTGAGDVAQH